MVSSVLASSAIALSATSASSASLSFNWSFTTISASTGGAGQIISGTIEGLQEGANDGTGLTINVTSTPTGELTGGGWTFDPPTLNGGDAFTVNNGEVTFADASFIRTGAGVNDQLEFGGFGGLLPRLADRNDFDPFWFNDADRNTFTPIPELPEPSMILGTVVVLALGGLFGKGKDK